MTARESLVVAVDRADAADLKTVAEWLAAQGYPVTPTSAARDLEPLLAQGIRHGFRAETELAVDNRAVVDALAAHCERLGVQWAPPVGELSEARADTVVIANGIDAPSLWPGLPIRPVKGEVLRLRWRRGCMPVPQRVIRARVHGRQVYLVPRHDGVVVGATQYEHGRDTAPAVAGVRELLDDACAVMPALGEYEFAECAAGLRPMTPDGLPDRRPARRAHAHRGWTRPQRIPAGTVDGRGDPGRAERCSAARSWFSGERDEDPMKVTVNDEAVEVDERTTVAALLETLGFPEKGIAVAVDWSVLPRSEWETTLADGARVEVVTAVQGG